MLVLLDWWGWRPSLLVLTGFMLVALLPIVNFREPYGQKPDPSQFVLLDLVRFCRRPQIWRWLIVLMLFSTGPMVGNTMFRPLLVDIGLSMTDIGLLLGAIGYAAGIFGAIAAGLLVTRLGRWRSLFWFCGLRVCAIAAYLLPALGMVNLPLLYAVAIGSQLTNGMAMTALFTVMMDRSKLTIPGTDFTLQTSLIYFGGIFAAPLSGLAAAAWGYEGAFVLAIALGLGSVASIFVLVERNIAIVLRWGLLAVSGGISHQIAYSILYDIRVKLAEKLGRLPLSYLNRSSTGTLKKIVNEDVEYLEQMFAHGIPEGIGLITTFTLSVLFLFSIDWRMALATLAGIPLSIGSQYLLFKDLQPILKAYYDSQDRMNATVIEYVRGMPVIKTFTQTIESFDRYEKSVRNYQEVEEDWAKRSLLPWTLFSISVTINLIVILPVGLYFFQQGSLSLATFILFLLLGIGVSAPLLRLLESVEVYVQTQKGLERIFAILNEPELSESESLDLPKDLTLEFCNVSFAYEEKEVLQNINLKISPGRVAALVGASSSGKTTIARLLGRFWEASQGEICLGGININRLKLNDLLSQMAFVFQEVSLFNDTIYNNIRMGKPNASREEVFVAAKAAQCHDFIDTLPQGYNTIIGERGAKLSGGQKQRISIARAILKDAPIVILDEATAFLDPESEAQVQAAISQLIVDKTLLVIAHRLFTIVDADQIVVMDKGTICDRGTHAELLETCEIYRHLWDAHLQAKGWTLQERQISVLNAVSS